MQHSFSVNNRDLCAVKAGPWWTNSMAQLQQTTHRWGRFPSFRGADESEILGLVSTEWGRSVLCHHWYVVWRRCGGHRRALWDKTKKNIWDTNATSDVFKLLEKHPLFFFFFLFSLLSAFQELFSDETSWGYICRWCWHESRSEDARAEKERCCCAQMK